jgi:putative MATE family efflux protein
MGGAAEDAVDAGTVIEPIGPRAPAGLPNHLPMPRLVLALAIWPFLDNLMVFLVSFVDTALAGHLDTQVMDAVGAAGYFLWLIGLLQGAVGVGATALVSRSIGAGRFAEAHTALGQSIFLALVWGLFNGVLFFTIAPAIGHLLNLEGVALDHCTMYLRVLAIVAPCRAVLFIGNACLRGAGDMRSPFFIMLTVNLLNIGASVALVQAGWSIKGIAIGTAIAWTIGALTNAVLLGRGLGNLRLKPSLIRPQSDMLRRLVRIGAPNLAENLLHWGGNFIVVFMVGLLPELLGEQNVLGAHMIAVRIEALSFMPGFAIGIAAATLAGQYLGANDPQRARHAIWLCVGFGAAFCTTLGVVFITIPQVLTRIVTDQPEYLEVVPRLLFICGWVQVGFAAYLVLAGALRGAGDTRMTMWLTTLTTFAIRLPLSWLLAITLGWGLVGIWVALSIELMVRGLVFLLRFLHGGWARLTV